MRPSINIPEGSFFGGDIEPGTFHCGIDFEALIARNKQRAMQDREPDRSSQVPAQRPAAVRPDADLYVPPVDERPPVCA